jgi:hypothetical protein
MNIELKTVFKYGDCLTGQKGKIISMFNQAEDAHLEIFN